MPDPSTPAPLEVVDCAPPAISASDIEAVTEVLQSGWLTTGEQSAAFEAELAAFLGAPHVVSVSSCTAALEIAMAFLQPPPGSLVAVPAWTFAASALAACRQGCIPVLVDSHPDDLNIDPTSLDEVCDQFDNVAAVIPVHLGGVPVASEVRRVSASRAIPMVDDAAHALGAKDQRGLLNGGGPGVLAACFSFYASKNLTCGEGGAIATFDEGFARFARSFRLHGFTAAGSEDQWQQRARPYDVELPGIKANLPDLLAALGRSQLARYSELQRARARAVARYRDHLRQLEGIDPIPTDAIVGSANHLMLVRLGAELEREKVMAGLRDRGICTSVHFVPLHHLTWFARHAVIPSGGLPVADRLAEKVLTLPLHPRLSDDQVDRVCEALAEVTT